MHDNFAGLHRPIDINSSDFAVQPVVFRSIRLLGDSHEKNPHYCNSQSLSQRFNGKI